MSPKAADPAVRTALLENAARLIATEGSAGLTLRRLADAAGTSTMAIYTHFGGMQHLRAEVRREGFARLRARLETVEQTKDPVADLARFAQEYHVNAGENSHLYRAMFMDVPQPEDTIGMDDFDLVVDNMRRCQAAGRFVADDPVAMSLQMWSAGHGVVALQLAGLLPDALALATLAATFRSLCLAFGDEPARLDRSLAKARRAAGLSPTPRPSLGRYDASQRH